MSSKSTISSNVTLGLLELVYTSYNRRQISRLYRATAQKLSPTIHGVKSGYS